MEIKHGTISGYYGQGCRCADCREAARVYYYVAAAEPRKPCQEAGCTRNARVRGRFCDPHIRRRQGLHPDSKPRAYGDSVGYDAAHKRLIRARGPARAHECVSCSGMASQWAYVHGSPGERPAGTKGNGRPHGPFSLDFDHYQPMCSRCHKIYDLSLGRATA